ncbi:hypothetical protein KS2013_1406 [Kangiella sediminilitoris]|uniref:DUF2066 domain-containing protein n=2 Tax=Kangiella sediminilitoris TaxID=1144748 RepID=A0A1B3BBF1_9GAMM|nr:hypothetical protein KS2013_1406 [Kangiella sediminilitoris]
MAQFLKLILMVLAATVAFSQPSKAEQVPDLYSATWPVDSQSSALRTQAIKKSFEQTLIRVSGDRNVLRSPTVRDAVEDAEQYLRRYSYQKLSAAEQMIFEKPLLLKGTFDKSSILRLLKQASKPIWGEDRPSGIFWIAYETSGLRKIASDEVAFINAALNISAEKRGLPITMPLMDIEDQSALEVADVWGRFESPLERASQRYSRDYWVAGSLSRNSSQWQGSWLFTYQGRSERFSTVGRTSFEAINAAVNRVADSLSAKLAVVLSEHAQEIFISVENLRDFESFAGLQKYLNSLAMVKSASAVEVAGDTVLFKVESLTAPQNLIEAITLGNNLQRSNYGFEPIDSLRGDFHFIWETP